MIFSEQVMAKVFFKELTLLKYNLPSIKCTSFNVLIGFDKIYIHLCNYNHNEDSENFISITPESSLVVSLS